MSKTAHQCIRRGITWPCDKRLIHRLFRSSTKADATRREKLQPGDHHTYTRDLLQIVARSSINGAVSGRTTGSANGDRVNYRWREWFSFLSCRDNRRCEWYRIYEDPSTESLEMTHHATINSSSWKYQPEQGCGASQTPPPVPLARKIPSIHGTRCRIGQDATNTT